MRQRYFIAGAGMLIAGLGMMSIAAEVFTLAKEPPPIVAIVGGIFFFTWWIPCLLGLVVVALGFRK